ncbi:MAG: thioredoxin-disulfide reductase [Holophagaceae bacterium]|uniref:Thioredoxin reductase n=1 Tax=Candidatus Geothrix odensensis TaxID=2954440 RepID=A0A936EZP3_9BACT|nr:thioredoxin-disulfide reductase [Candidatus Geothrix odensensis]MBK8790077.1 thioredoxin-disulfide reductase [Holophagaceae bacterium]
MSHHKVIVIGTGPAGYTAALYTSRANLAPLVFEGVQPGGQLTITTEVENFPGFRKGIEGPALMEEMREQVLRFGTTIKPETVLKADLQSRPFKLTTDKAEYTADAVIIATGASAMWLGIDKDEQLSRSGGGVSACATCDGFFFRGKEIAVVGGGDTAVEEATFLTKFATKVHLIHRRDKLRASKAMQERAFKNEKIQPVWNKVVLDVLTNTIETPMGEKVEKIRALKLKDTVDGSESELPVEGLFVAIGHRPNTSLFAGQLPMDETGYLLVEKGSSRTSIPGVFACGDVQDHTYRQAITAAGSGCMAAIDAERWLAEQGLAE